MADFVERELRTVPGPPTERDGEDGSGLTVDFTFDDADPSFAVEVTRLRDDFELWEADDVRRFKARIKQRAKAKGWPTNWSIGLSPEASFKADLAPAKERMLEWMRGVVGQVGSRKLVRRCTDGTVPASSVRQGTRLHEGVSRGEAEGRDSCSAPSDERDPGDSGG